MRASICLYIRQCGFVRSESLRSVSNQFLHTWITAEEKPIRIINGNNKRILIQKLYTHVFISEVGRFESKVITNWCACVCSCSSNQHATLNCVYGRMTVCYPLLCSAVLCVRACWFRLVRKCVGMRSSIFLTTAHYSSQNIKINFEANII